MKKKRLLAIIALVLAFAVAGCAGTQQRSGDEDRPSGNGKKATSAPADNSPTAKPGDNSPTPTEKPADSGNSGTPLNKWVENYAFFHEVWNKTMTIEEALKAYREGNLIPVRSYSVSWDPKDGHYQIYAITTTEEFWAFPTSLDGTEEVQGSYLDVTGATSGRAEWIYVYMTDDRSRFYLENDPITDISELTPYVNINH